MSVVAMVSPDYLLRHVASGDGQANSIASADTGKAASPLTRYYTGDGYPPGRWIGSGLAGLADGVGIEVGNLVTEEQMRRLFQDRVDPVTGKQLLARATPKYVPRGERVARRMAALEAKHPEMSADELGAARRKILREERGRAGNAVLGFDLTFKPPKSVSVLWGVADHGTQVQLYEAHQEAIEATLAVIEREVLHTRTGAQGVRRVTTRGLVAAAFDHWDSRKGDPLLHTHVTVANAVQAAGDGVWRTIDSRALYRATVAASETYQIFVADAVTRRLGLGWESRARAGSNRAAARELADVPAELVTEFSQRSAAIEKAVDEAVAAYKDAHGGAAPSQSTLLKMRQAQVLKTRTAKHVRGLSVATDDWRGRAEPILGADPIEWAASLERHPTPLLTVDDVADADRKAVAASVVETVMSKRAVWSRWNLHAEAMRQISARGWQFTTSQGAWEVADGIVGHAIDMSLSISGPQLASVPDALRNTDGTSQLANAPVYTSEQVLAAEARLIALADHTSGPTVALDRAEQIAARHLPGKDYALDIDDQAPAAVAIATSGRVVDVLEGPAGTGKTTTMSGVRAMWEAEYGPGSVKGLAPSSKAADVLAAGLGIATENTAQWLKQQDAQPARQTQIAALSARLADPRLDLAARSRITSKLTKVQAEYSKWSLAAGQLLVVDEAGMAGTFALDKLAGQAAQAGAKLLLVGDPRQLAAVEVGGAFGLLTTRRGDTPRLSVIRRFVDSEGQRRRWEEDASMAVRLGKIDGAADYIAHGRVTMGGRDEMLNAAYSAWFQDTRDGKVAILIAGDNTTVTELNARARADLVDAGTVAAAGNRLHDGTTAGDGDRIVTRKIDRWIADGTVFTPAGQSGRRSTGFVRNGQQWIVKTAHPDGSLTVTLADTDRAGASSAAPITLPAAYVAEHVELAYATTAHRSQGMTVDTGHTVADTTTSRELLYVALTRGRRHNAMYLVSDPAEVIAEHQHAPTEAQLGDERDLLATILRNSSAPVSAHETLAAEQAAAGSLRQLAAEYATIAAHGHELAAADLLEAADVPNLEAVIAGADFRHVTAATRAAHAAHVDTGLLARLLASADWSDAPTAAEVAEEIRTITQDATAGKSAPTRRLIAGIIPDAARGITDEQVRTALSERAVLMESRLDALTAAARDQVPAWMPPRPAHPGHHRQWDAVLRGILAYRDRWGIDDEAQPLGVGLDRTAGVDQRIDYRRNHADLKALTGLVDHLPQSSTDPAVQRPHAADLTR